jgi:hypothetical protein
MVVFFPGEPGNAIRFLGEGPGPAVIVRLIPIGSQWVAQAKACGYKIAI